MAQATRAFADLAVADDSRQAITNYSYQAYRLLQIGFVVAPIVAGVDKFFNLLIDWNRYLPAFVKGAVGGQGHELMMLVGGIEIIAGLGVALKPQIFSYVVAGWLGVIIVNLLLIPGHFDVALRDVGLMIGALALARLSHEFNS